jgi:hypothetical protein
LIDESPVIDEAKARRYLNLYHIEGYLFDEVGPAFRETGQLSAFDFFCIIAWKSNRSKSYVAKRLLKKGYADLEGAASALGRAIFAAGSDLDKFRVLFENWGFSLPLASAILTVLYEERFTVYDWRAFEQVLDVAPDLKDPNRTSDLAEAWTRYEQYRSAVRNAVDANLPLRDKDRVLWARSSTQQMKRDIERAFGVDAASAG